MKCTSLPIVALSLFSWSICTAQTATPVGGSMLKQQQSKSFFEENKGQVTGTDATKVQYTYKNGNLSVFLLNDALAYQFTHIIYPEGYKHLDKFAKPEEREEMEALAKNIQTETYRMDLSLEGANPNSVITTEGRSSDYVQYYNHNALDVHSYSEITYHNVYPNIDWVVYQQDDHLKYDFVVRPGGNPAQIQLRTHWPEKQNLNNDGSLSLQNRIGTITEKAPVSYQANGANIPTHFVQDNKGLISFAVGNYNVNETLVIDPSIVWATYYGGSDNEGRGGCATDAQGNIYMAGISLSSNNIANGGYQNTFGGGDWDAFLVKFNSIGQRKWATYYGGNDGDNGTSCATDAQGNVYLAGITNSTNNIFSGGSQNAIGGIADAFLVKFDSTGQRLWGTYYGGSDNDAAFDCSTDAQGNIYLTGRTASSNNIANNGFQNTFGGVGYSDAFLVKFNSSGQRQWATYYGDANNDEGYECAVDASGNVYMTGITFSTNNIASGGFQNTFGGGNYDAFLVKFNSGGQRQWATYYGGSNYDAGVGCATDAQNNVYISGSTSSTNSIANGGFQNTIGGLYDAFLVKFNSAGQRQWATYYGDTANDYFYNCSVDVQGNVYVSGETGSTINIASGGFQNTYGGGISDIFLVKFNASGQRQWASYYGGNSADGASECVIAPQGNLFIAGNTTSTTNIASGGFQNTYAGNRDVFLAKINPSSAGINEFGGSDASLVQLYPNPFKGEATLKVPVSYQHNTYQVFDIQGNVIIQEQISTLETKLNLSSLSGGVYIIRVGTVALKLVKQ